MFPDYMVVRGNLYKKKYGDNKYFNASDFYSCKADMTRYSEGDDWKHIFFSVHKDHPAYLMWGNYNDIVSRRDDITMTVAQYDMIF